ncbi:MAG: DNA translocase FtsK [Janthinobacterium lividum]
MATLAQTRRALPQGAAGTLASPEIRRLARQRLTELGGLALGLCGVGILVALASYNPRDPSLNTATSVHVTNLVGPAGAVLSDLLLQGFGLAGALPGVAMLAWAWRIAMRRGVGRVSVRLGATLLALPVLGAALGTLPVGAGMAGTLGSGVAWPTSAGLGGAAGRVLGLGVLGAARASFGPVGTALVWVVGLALALGLVLVGLGLTPGEWRAAGRGARRGVAGAGAGLAGAGLGLAGAARRGAAPGLAGLRFAGLGRGRAKVAGEGGAVSRLAALLPRERMAEEDAAEAAAPPRAVRREPVMGLGGTVRRAPVAAGEGGAAKARDDAFPHVPPPPAPPAPQEAGDEAAVAATPVVGLPVKAVRARPGAGAVAAALRVVAPRAAPRILAAAEPPALASRPEAETEGGWRFPPLSLLKPAPERGATGPSEEALQSNARLLETVLNDYGVQGAIREIRPGPVVTLYELEPAPGIRSARVIGLADDIARSLSVTAVRIATVPGRNVIGIEVPNSFRETVYLSELLGAEEWAHHPSRLALALGKDIAGLPIVADLARMPHLLVAGTTGSGKSVGINAMILSLLFRLSPEQCRMILIDPKMLELSVYDGIPHLMAPVVTEPAKAVTALKWTVREMERRYRAMSQLGVRNVGGYNDRVSEAVAKGEVVTRRVQTGFDSETGRPIFEEQPLALETLPFLVVIIDEMADLMMTAGKEIEAAIQRLAQMARAAGIHVVMATQRPSVDVITGTIKANFPTRISYQVISKFDSRTILGEQGAEQLLGQGDLLYMQGGGRIGRVHGPFVGDREVEDVVAFLREQGEPSYLDEVTEGSDDDDGANSALSGIAGAGDGEKGLFDQAVDVVSREGKASTSFIQRHLSIGYNRAAKLIEQMEKEGIVSPANHVGKREVLVRRSDD